VRWVVDTSAWARREIPEVRRQLEDILAERDESEFVLSPVVLLELLRGPQGDADVSAERGMLTSSMATLGVDAATFELAADAMEALARHDATAHRLPVADLVTAALAHQHRSGVVHCDDHFELLANCSGLQFVQRRIELPADDAQRSSGHLIAGRQRALKQEPFQLLHREPVADAEAFLERTVRALRERGEP